MSSPKRGQLFLLLVFVPLILVNAVCGLRMHKFALERTERMEDYSTINSLSYGLFSVDLWRDMVKRVVTERINDFKVSPKQEEVLRHEAETILNALLKEAGLIAQKPRRTVSEKIKRRIELSLIKSAKENVPRFARAVTDEVQKPANLRKIKDVALDEFNKLINQTHGDSEDRRILQALLEKNGVKTVEEFNAISQKELAALNVSIFLYTWILIGTAVVFLLTWWLCWKRTDLHRLFFSLSAAFALLLLLTSLSTPMMEVDARVQSVNFTLLGEKLEFKEQVLYYRSKSLMQMVRLLLASEKVDTVGVGVLIFLFSIVFPMAKLLSAQAYLLGGEAVRKSRLVHFFAFKSSKWSMADVMVVAVFMAYIGFQSIVNNQLENLNIKTSSLESITTDASSVQAGFLLFTTFVLFGLALSDILKSITSRPAAAVAPSLADRAQALKVVS